MARRGRPTVEITLSGDERKTLQRWAQRHCSSQALALRCRIVLACAEGRPNGEVATELRVHPTTVSKWRHRFAKDRIDGLVDAPRPGAARTIGDDVIEAIIVETLETAPPDATHLSTRGLAAKHGISHTTVGAIWRAFGLKPWRQDSFKVSPDPELVEKIRDLVGLYMNPPVAAAVFAIDEKPQIQALNRTAPTLPMLPTTPARATHNYVHVILDNLATHKTPTVQRWLLRHRRFHFHFTPTYGSWMNLVERWFSALTTKKLQRSAHRSVKELAADIQAWADHWNDNPTPFVWHKSAEQILERLAGYCVAINQGADT